MITDDPDDPDSPHRKSLEFAVALWRKDHQLRRELTVSERTELRDWVWNRIWWFRDPVPEPEDRVASPPMATQLRESLLIELRAHFRAEFVNELHSMTLAQIIALSGGGAPTQKSAGDGVGNERKAGRPKKTAAATAPKESGKRARRNAEDIKALMLKICSLLSVTKGGLTSEQIQESLGVSKKDLVGPIAMGLEEGSITKTGEKRGTKYHTRGR